MFASRRVPGVAAYPSAWGRGSAPAPKRSTWTLTYETHISVALWGRMGGAYPGGLLP